MTVEQDWKAKFMRVVFPREIHRVQYFIRFVIFMVGCLILMSTIYGAAQAGPTAAAGLLVAVLFPSLIVFRIASMDLPRLRSMGWTPWLILIFLIPMLNLAMQVLLFFMPPKNAAAAAGGVAPKP